MIYNAEIEQMPIEKLRGFQSDKFSELVNYMHAHQPFYQQQWDEAGIDINTIKSIDQISKLPFTRKEHLRDNYPFGLLAVPFEQVVRIHCSSGSTGKPTVVGYTRQDLEVFSEVVARSLCCAGAKPGMKLHNAYGYGLFTGGLGLHYGAEQLGMSVIPVSGGMTERQLMLLHDFKSEVISCTPSYALTLADEVRKRGLDINLKYAVLGAEPWTEAVREEVEEKLQVTATNIYGLSEIIGPGVSQEDYEEKNGSHIWEDHFYPEIVDPESGELLEEGQEGVLILTTLTKKAMPLMRYWTNDICSLYYDPDSKRTHVKMSAIKGRYDDMLIIRGVNLFHTQVEAVLADIREFSNNYQLVVTRDDRRMDSVEVKVELTSDVYREVGESPESMADNEHLRELKQKLGEKIRGNIGLNMQVTLAGKGSIPRSEGGKLSRVVDER